MGFGSGISCLLGGAIRKEFNFTNSVFNRLVSRGEIGWAKLDFVKSVLLKF